MNLVYSPERRRFEALQSFPMRERLKEDGFMFDWDMYHETKVGAWCTADIEIAFRYRTYADSATLDIIEQRMNHGIKSTAQLTYENGWFILRGNQFLAERLGFKFTQERGFGTQAISLAADAIEYADGEALRRLSTFADFQTETLRLSRAEDADPGFEIPANPGCVYYPYQRAGIQFCMQRPGTLIGDVMGLGKTIQALGVVNCSPGASRVLIACPAYLKLQWKREAEIWLTNKQLRIGVATTKRFPVFSDLLDVGRIVIINYELIGKYFERLARVPWDILIGDEAHYIKNPSAQRTKHFKKLKADRKMLLTGTPLPNRPREVFSLAHYLDPVTWSSKAAFDKRYCDGQLNEVYIAGGKTRKVMDNKGASNLDELQTKLRSSIMVRRDLSVLPDLPPKIRQVMELNFGRLDHEQDFLNRNPNAMGFMRKMIGEANEDDRAGFEALVERIGGKEAAQKQAAMMGELARIRHETALMKVPEAIRLIDDYLEEKPKLVIMAHHRDVLELLHEKYGERSVLVYGGLDVEKVRQPRIDEWKSNPEIPLFLCSMSTATGMNLFEADTVIFIEFDFVPGIMNQAEGRLLRIGQKADRVNSIYVVLKDSIDAYMVNMLIEKQAVIDAALDTKSEQELVTSEV